MRKDAVEITLEPAHVGMILMRPYPGEERGLLLLNVAETEARIRFLSGFVSVSFFVDRQSGIVAEYLRWRSADDVGHAFRQPAFFEHLPVLETMSEHPTIVFGPPAAVMTRGGETAFTLGHDSYAMTVLRCEPAGLEAARVATAGWCHALVQRDDVDAVAIHVDQEGGQIAVLVAGRFAALAPPDTLQGSADVVEHLGAIQLYGSVTASANPAQAIRYSMVVQS